MAGSSCTTNTAVATGTGLDTKLGTVQINEILCILHQVLILSDLNSDHFKVSQCLQNLDKNHMNTLGGALGLSYGKLCKMTKYPNEMVTAWLRKEDYVLSMSGEPTWRSLVKALRITRQEGIAQDIEKKVASYM